MSVQTVNWLLLTPVLGQVAAMLLVLAVQAVAPGHKRVLDGLLALGLVGSAAGVVAAGAGQTFCTTGGCSYQVGDFTIGLQLIVLAAAAVTALLLTGEDDRSERDSRTAGLHRAELWALLSAGTAGALALVAARDLFTLLIALETATLPVIGLVGLTRTAEAARAATRLLLVSVGSFGLALLGVALLYAAHGSVYLSGLGAAQPVDGAAALGAAGALVFLCGVGYKVAVLPFGLWAPDVYPAVPPAVAGYLSTVSKVAGVSAAALVLGSLPGVRGGTVLAVVPADVLAVVLAVGLTLANAVALTRRSALGLLAWSTMAQAAWAVLPLAATGVSAQASLGAIAGYLIAYVSATLVAFAVVVLLARHHRAGARHLLSDYTGLFRSEPVAATLLGFALLNLAGLPPGVAGLVAKVLVLRPVLEGAPLWLAVVAAVNVAIALAYYLRWIWLMFAPEPAALRWRVSVAEGLALSASAGLLVLLSILPGLLV